MAKGGWPGSKCDRCGADLKLGSTMSKFNTDQLCMACKADERLAPNYALADAAELAQVRAGNYNYGGVGLASEDVQFLAERRAARAKEVTQ